MTSRWLVALFLCVSASGAHAELIRVGDGLDDTQTGLRWSAVQLPTATFVLDSTTLTVATMEQFQELIDHVPYPQSGPFDPQAQDFFDWFHDTASWVYAGEVSNGEVGQCFGPNGGGDCYRAAGAYYGPDYSMPGIWTWGWAPTIDTYGPTYPVNHVPWETDNVIAWAVQPVPLPGAAILFAGGLALFSAIRRKRALPA